MKELNINNYFIVDDLEIINKFQELIKKYIKSEQKEGFNNKKTLSDFQSNENIFDNLVTELYNELKEYNTDYSYNIIYNPETFRIIGINCKATGKELDNHILHMTYNTLKNKLSIIRLSDDKKCKLEITHIIDELDDK